MEYTRLGKTGMKVSRICLGCRGFGDATRWIHQWVLNEENSRAIIQKSLELGINFFDTANVYSLGTSEEYLGRALKDFAIAMLHARLEYGISTSAPYDFVDLAPVGS
jgi:1-deoxyxylulose-5-phosphate synthase